MKKKEEKSEIKETYQCMDINLTAYAHHHHKKVVLSHTN